jgi:hypothetical protein
MQAGILRGIAANLEGKKNARFGYYKAGALAIWM